ncbi:MAG TPA: haloacid dehalogenase-like hydrolase [Thermomicrobiaceae bacterium]|nr:haloacid dehalogenase-like hydrolase [Thermomicrobiaceae bacterium]
MRGLVLFDIDGTLLRAGDPDHQLAFVEAMQQVYGLPATLDGVPLAGMLDAQIARLALGRHGLAEAEIDARLAEMVALMGERYAAKVARDSRIERLLPGVVGTLERLQGDGFALGVLTGNVRSVAHAKLAAAGIRRFFATGAFGDSARERGHLVEAAQTAAAEVFHQEFPGALTVLVGDTPRDIAAARHGGALVIAVATGRYDPAQLAAAQPDAVFPDLSDVAAVAATVERLVG